MASTSPRRKELLRLTGLNFRIVPSEYEEEMNSARPPRSLARHLSLQKAKSVAENNRNAVVIAADTFIVLGNKLLGKPHTEREALRMLGLLSGRPHSVITGFAVIDTATGKRVARSVETKVYFRRLTRKEILSYVRTGEPLDKAGGYAIQGLGGLLVKRIEGDYFNVIGLPLSALLNVLRQFGIRVL